VVHKSAILHLGRLRGCHKSIPTNKIAKHSKIA
jgi:hypothetical protein